MVEGGAKVVDRVGDQEAGGSTGRRFADVSDEHDVSRRGGTRKNVAPGTASSIYNGIEDRTFVHIRRDPVRVALQESVEQAVKRFQVHIRTADEREAVIEGRR
jgi:hypothetical protein